MENRKPEMKGMNPSPLVLTSCKSHQNHAVLTRHLSFLSPDWHVPAPYSYPGQALPAGRTRQWWGPLTMNVFFRYLKKIILSSPYL